MIPRVRLLCLALLVVGGGCRSPGGGGASVSQATPTAQADTAQAYELIRREKYAEAEPLLLRAVETDPVYGPAHNDLGLIYYRTDRLYQAAWELELASRQMPHQPEPLNNLGLVLERAGKLDEAMADYSQAVKLDPNSADYLGNLARVRVRLGLRDEQTRRILRELLLKDSRPQWRQWAQITLLRLAAAPPDSDPATQPTK